MTAEVDLFEEERYFLHLFDRALSLRRGNITDEELSGAVGKVAGRFHGGPANSCSLDKYETRDDLCAYFIRLSPISAGLARSKTLAAIRECEVFKSCLKRRSLRIISLGCGPGSDIVGLCSALYKTAEFKQLALTLVDFNKGWKPFFQQIELLLCDEQEHFGNSSLLFQNKEISSLFICSNVTAKMQGLKEADVVWMKGLLSVLPSNTEIYKSIELVVSSMAPGALLVVIDSPTYIEHIHNSRFSGDIKQVYYTKDGNYKFPLDLRMLYGPGISQNSNQEMFIFVKREKAG